MINTPSNPSAANNPSITSVNCWDCCRASTCRSRSDESADSIRVSRSSTLLALWVAAAAAVAVSWRTCSIKANVFSCWAAYSR